MAEEEDGEPHPLGLLVDLRDLCRRIGEDHHQMAAELHDLLRQVQNPNAHDVDKSLSFRVMQLERSEEQYPETIRAISLNGSSIVARAAFFAAVKAYPNSRWVLRWGMMVLERYEPKKSAS